VRCGLPAILVPGGTQLNAPDYFTSNKLWPLGMHVSRGEKPHEELVERQKNACPTCGACQLMGSASTGQVLAEALGLALPGSALIPAPLTMPLRYARAAGKQILHFQLDNVSVTPHAAYDSEESIRLVRTIAANEVVRVLTGQRPRSPVNVVERAERDSA